MPKQSAYPPFWNGSAEKFRLITSWTANGIDPKASHFSVIRLSALKEEAVSTFHTKHKDLPKD